MSNTTSPGTFARALQERRRRGNRRKVIGASIGALVLLLGGLGVYLLFYSGLFAVSEVSVRGNDLVTTERVLETARVPMGEPLLTADLRAVSARLDDLVEVDRVRVERRLPGTVAIEVTERVVVYQRLFEGDYHWVDRGGIVFRTLPTAEPGVIVAVTASDDIRLLADVATVIAHLPDELLPRVEQVDARGVDEILIELADGVQVVWGSADESELKAEVLSALLAVDAKVYDVSAPGHPTTK